MPRLTLSEYVTTLIEALGTSNPAALARMRQVVMRRRARIILDDEAVDISFGLDGLAILPSKADETVSGTGQTNSATVMDLLDGHVEIADVILDGRLNISGLPEDIARMFMAIEILLDASPRTPELQGLAARFRRERRESRVIAMPSRGKTLGYPFSSGVTERELLARLDLLPDDSDYGSVPKRS